MNDAYEDARSGNSNSSSGDMKRLLTVLDAEPLKGLLTDLDADFDFDAWCAECRPDLPGAYGTGKLAWPTKLETRIACRLALVREAAAQHRGFLDFTNAFIGAYGDFDDRWQGYIAKVVTPLLRDVLRVAEQYQPGPGLAVALGRPIPRTVDAKLDQLLGEAVRGFREAAPDLRKKALERLFDAWERLKSLKDADKRHSVDMLLAQAVPEENLRGRAKAEAMALTDLGNKFEFRHFERDKVPVSDPAHLEYIFHRLFATIWLLLPAITNPQEEQSDD